MTDCLMMPGDLQRLASETAWRLGNLLDLRPAAAFAAGHLPRAVSRPLEPRLVAAGSALDAALLTDLPSIFLPPRHEPLAVVLANGDLAAAVATGLEARGRARVLPVALPDSAVLDLPAEWRAVGPSSRVLWRPPEFLARWRHLLPPPTAGGVLDVACGSGRAAVWLAAQGYGVTGIDHQPEALDLARRLALEHGTQLELLQADLRRPGAVPTRRWSVVLFFRYLQRDLLRDVGGLLAPGGIVVVRTFRQAPGYVGNPQSEYRLARGELLALLPDPPYECLVHEEDFDADGKPAAGIVARIHANGRP